MTGAGATFHNRGTISGRKRGSIRGLQSNEKAESIFKQIKKPEHTSY